VKVRPVSKEGQCQKKASVKRRPVSGLALRHTRLYVLQCMNARLVTRPICVIVRSEYGLVASLYLTYVIDFVKNEACLRTLLFSTKLKGPIKTGLHLRVFYQLIRRAGLARPTPIRRRVACNAKPLLQSRARALLASLRQ